MCVLLNIMQGGGSIYYYPLLGLVVVEICLAKQTVRLFIAQAGGDYFLLHRQGAIAFLWCLKKHREKIFCFLHNAKRCRTHLGHAFMALKCFEYPQ